MAVSFAKIAITVCVICMLCLSSSQASDDGFSVELIHRDSPRSPFYDPAEASTRRFHKALSRTISRANRLSPTAGSGGEPFTEILSDAGEFLMNISIGTPPFQILGIADTGSDLIWTQCKPCENCYKQVDPLFDPSKSSTYRDVSCTSSQCSSLDRTSCDKTEGEICQYSYSYGDQSYTNGNIAVETVTLASTSGRPIAFPKTLIGCGHDNAGTFNDRTSGIIGLGGGSISLISQMGRATGGGFSYCLVPFFNETDRSSKLNFGSRAAVTGPGAVSTPFVQDSHRTFYYITLEAISVGKSRIPFGGLGGSVSEGNIIIDSGTTLTLLPADVYSKVESEVAKLIDLEPVPNPPSPLGLCYQTTADIKAPTIIVHFAGADVKLGPVNTFVRLEDDLICFSFAPTTVGVSIYGNLAQTNFLVGYDVANKAISFKPTECSKF